MLLRSMRVTEKIFGSRSNRKEQFCVVAKAVKSVHSPTQSFGNMVAKINSLTLFVPGGGGGGGKFAPLSVILI